MTKKSRDASIMAALVSCAVLLFVIAIVGASDELRVLILIIASVVVLGITFVLPNWGITIAYPLTWIFWGLNIDTIGGRPERLIVAIGLLGMTVTLAKIGKTSLGITKLVGWGIALFLVIFVLSFYANPTYPNGTETIVSLVLRVLFLFVVLFHLRTEQDLKVAIITYIAISFVPAILSLLLGLEFGFGFIRVYETNLIVRMAVNRSLLDTSFSASFATASALFMLAFYPRMQTSWSKRLLIGGVVFLFAMAFLCQLRREIIITIPILLAFFAFDKASGVQRIASRFLVVLIVVFPLVILPNFLTLQTRFHDENPQIAQGTDPRMMNFSAGLSAFMESPMIGTGPGSYRTALVPHLGENLPSFLYSPYNVFMWAAVEAGFLAVVVLLLMMYGVLVEGLRWRPRANGMSGLVLRLSPALIAQIFIWFTFGAAQDLSLPWFLMGLILAAARITKEKTEGIAH